MYIKRNLITVHAMYLDEDGWWSYCGGFHTKQDCQQGNPKKVTCSQCKRTIKWRQNA